MITENPFNPNSIVSPTLFAGRTEQISNILNKLDQVKSGMPVSFVLHGDRGIGKTALAKLIRYIASGEAPTFKKLSFTTSYYSVGKNQNTSSVLESSLNVLSDQLDKNVVKLLSGSLGKIFQNGKFTFGAFGYNYTNKDQELQGLKDRIVSILTNIITKNTNSDGILIIIDEIHNLLDLKGAAQVLRSISTTLDVNGCARISFMLLGYTESVQEFFEGDHSAKRHFESMPLTSMSNEEASEILKKGFDKVGVNYNSKEVFKYVKYTGGYPHSIQLLGHNIIAKNTNNTINENILKNAIIDTALDLRNKEFSDFYDFEGRPTLREKLLQVLAKNSPITKKHARELCDGKNIHQKEVLPRLIKLGAIKENKKTTELTLQSNLLKTAITLDIFLKNTKNYQKKESK